MLKTAIAFAESNEELRIRFESSGETWLASADLAVFDGVLAGAKGGEGVRLRMSDSRLRRMLLRAEREGRASRVSRPDRANAGETATPA